MPEEDWMRFVIIMFVVLMSATLIAKWINQRDFPKKENKIEKILREELNDDNKDDSQGR